MIRPGFHQMSSENPSGLMAKWVGVQALIDRSHALLRSWLWCFMRSWLWCFMRSWLWCFIV